MTEYGSDSIQIELITATKDLWESTELSNQTDSEIIPDTQSQQGVTYSRFANSHGGKPPLTKQQKGQRI